MENALNSDMYTFVFHKQPFDPSKDSLHSQSDHGYDPYSMEMRAIFYARGPAFKNNYRARALEMVGMIQG